MSIMNVHVDFLLLCRKLAVINVDPANDALPYPKQYLYYLYVYIFFHLSD
jgi:hypothetical protein